MMTKRTLTLCLLVTMKDAKINISHRNGIKLRNLLNAVHAKFMRIITNVQIVVVFALEANIEQLLMVLFEQF